MTTATLTHKKASKFLCAYCARGDHGLCPCAIETPVRMEVCRCRCLNRCRECRETFPDRDALTEDWTCIDYDRCAGTQAARVDNSLLAQLLREVVAESKAQRAADRLERAARREVRDALSLGSGDTETSEVAPAPSKPRSVPKRPVGPAQCLCCGDATKGGFYLPGHDSRHLSQMSAGVVAGTYTVEAAMDRLPSEHLRGKLVKRLARIAGTK